ncbi:MAG TPA: AEC family transporter [Geminicoccus sp.]|uniref:AEC family transporter n=1 Tax=Geminicoccus sp. TaxID=2024832 RepID=UPI002B761DAC|nr:AEC family transporter [Geminicoccus sp.]HWL71055.1 AEC family transporter [Geminicoccus sp.]
MSQILIDHLVPVYALVLLGRVLAGVRLVQDQQAQGISRFVFDVALPIMLARQMLTVDLPAQIEWRLVLVYFGCAFAVFALSAWFGRHVFAARAARPAIFGITACFGNVLVLSVPITIGVFGDQAAVPLFLLIAFHSATLFTLTTVVAELGIGAAGELRKLPRSVARSLITNPILVGLATGLLLRLSPVPVPAALDRTAAFLGQAAMPMALFALGANLARFRLGALWREALVLCLFKNLLFPLLVFAMATWVVPLDPVARAVAIVTAAMPAGINAYLFSVRYDTAVGEAGATIVVSTIVTFPILAWLLPVLREALVSGT